MKGGGSADGVDGSRGAAKGEKESPFDGLSPLSTVSGLTGGGAADWDSGGGELRCPQPLAKTETKVKTIAALRAALPSFVW